MKIVLCSLVGLLSYALANAQQFVGYSYNNYEAVSGVVFNPAGIVGSRYSADIHLFSVNTGVGTSAYTISRKSLFNNGFSDIEKGRDYSLTNNDPMRFWVNVDVLGPSFMFAIDDKNAVAFTSRLRVTGMQNNFARDILAAIEDESNIFGQMLTGSNMQTDVHAFSNFGLSYARVLLDNEKYTLKVGATVNYIAGLGGGSVRSNNLNIDLRDEDFITSLQGDITVAYSKAINDYFGDEDFSVNTMGDNNGFGFDLGAVYELRKTNKPSLTTDEYTRKRGDYWLRFALSVTDIGSIKYKTAPESKSFAVNIQNVSYDDIDINNFESLDDYLAYMQTNGFFTEKGVVGDYKVSLPTMLRANIDWNVNNKVYVNLNAAKNLVAGNTYGAKYLDYYMVTPRYETKWLGVASPVSINGAGQFNWGFGVNVGVFYFGSGSMLSNLLKTNLSSMDVYVGFHVPIYKKNRTIKAAHPAIQEMAPAN